MRTFESITNPTQNLLQLKLFSEGKCSVEWMTPIYGRVKSRENQWRPLRRIVLNDDHMSSNSWFHLGRRRKHKNKLEIYMRIKFILPFTSKILSPIPKISKQGNPSTIKALGTTSCRCYIPCHEVSSTWFALPCKRMNIPNLIDIFNDLRPLWQSLTWNEDIRIRVELVKCSFGRSSRVETKSRFRHTCLLWTLPSHTKKTWDC